MTCNRTTLRMARTRQLGITELNEQCDITCEASYFNIHDRDEAIMIAEMCSMLKIHVTFVQGSALHMQALATRSGRTCGMMVRQEAVHLSKFLLVRHCHFTETSQLLH